MLSWQSTVNVSTFHMPSMLVHEAKAKLPIDLALATSSNTPSKLFAHKATELVKQACKMISKA